MQWVNKSTSIFETLRVVIRKNNIIFFALLLLQNIAIFWQHYFNNFGFPLDFKAYYAHTVFWITSISMGIFPQWIPYQSMGYPIAINAQSGLYYPIFWIFALLHIPYTLHAAVIVQVIHVFFGSIGMFLLLNLIFKSPRYAFVGAVAFQFFGGFYSNAEHSDIIRAFALTPWLFYVFKLNMDDPKVTRRLFFIPIIVYLLTTGAYPGNFISGLFIISVFVLLQIFDGYLKVKRRALKVGVVMAGFALLGISVALVHLGPIWQERDELSRLSAGVSTDWPWVGLPIKAIPTLFMSNRPVGDWMDFSMTSTFVTLPMLVFASFVPIDAIRKYWVFVVVLTLSFLMVAGPNSPFWQAITSEVPALKLSRFPSSDYRSFIAIPVMILGTAGLKAIIERRLSWKEFTARAAFVFTWFSLGVFLLYSGSNFFISNADRSLGVIEAVFILIATLSLISYHVFKNGSKERLSARIKVGTMSKLGLALVVILLSSDGLRVIYDMQWWRDSPYHMSWFYGFPYYNGPLEKNGKLVTFSIFDNIPNERPPRHAVGSNVIQDIFNQYSWRGSLRGDYMMEDYSNTVLNARSVVDSNVLYRNYMLMKWTPLLLEPSLVGNPNSTSITLPVSTFSNTQLIQAQLNPSSEIIQTRYGINDISYKVSLKEPKLMVENEIYFPGWHADLNFQDKEMKLQALVVNDVFRAWLLPAGNYIMIAHFSFPNLIIYQGITIISFGIWIFIIVRYWRRLDSDSRQLSKEKEFMKPS